LENLGFRASVVPQGMQPSSEPSSSDSESESSSSDDSESIKSEQPSSPMLVDPPSPIPHCLAPNTNIQVRQESATPAPLLFDDEMEVPIRQESLTPPPLAFDDSEHEAQTARPKRKAGEMDQSDGSDVEEPEGDKAVHEGVANEELWEEELDENLAPNGLADIRDWETLRKQIIDDLKQKGKSFSLSQINQLMILRNFATLRIKGNGRIAASMKIAEQWHEKETGSSVHFARRVRALARHYQIFEQLPRERRGGYHNS
jgi:hypothetical protein